MLVWRLGVTVAVLIAVLIWGRYGEWEPVWRNRVFLFKGLVNSWILTLAATGIGLAAGIVLAAARLYAPAGLRHLAIAFIEIVRATPDLMVLFWIFFSAPSLLSMRIDAWPAAIASLAVIATVYLAEDIRAGLMSVPKVQIESGYATGLTPLQVFIYITLPQALRNMAPAIVTTVVKVFKITTIVFVVGVVEFFRSAIIVNNRLHLPYEMYFVVAMTFFLCCWGISLFVKWIAPKYDLSH